MVLITLDANSGYENVQSSFCSDTVVTFEQETRALFAIIPIERYAHNVLHDM